MYLCTLWKCYLKPGHYPIVSSLSCFEPKVTIYGVGAYFCVIFHHLAVIQCAAAIAVYNSRVLDHVLGDTHMVVMDQEFHVRVGGGDQPADISTLEFHIRVGGGDQLADISNLECHIRETNLLIFLPPIPPWSIILGFRGGSTLLIFLLPIPPWSGGGEHPTDISPTSQ